MLKSFLKKGQCKILFVHLLVYKKKDRLILLTKRKLTHGGYVSWNFNTGDIFVCFRTISSLTIREHLEHCFSSYDG